MVDIGDDWGVILSSAESAGVPSGDKVRYFCDNVKRKLVTKDKINHVSNQTGYIIQLKEKYYVCRIINANIPDATMTQLNLYHQYVVDWEESSSPIYFWCKDKAGVYMKFKNGSTWYNYIKCRIRNPEDGLSHKKIGMNVMVEECD